MKYTYTQFLVVETTAGGPTYTYLWEGDEEIFKGDWVRVPANHFKTNPQVLRVVATDSDYVGRLVNIMEKVPCTCEDPTNPLCYYHPGEGNKQF